MHHRLTHRTFSLSQVVLHAALSGGGLAAADGVEYVASRADKASAVLSDLLGGVGSGGSKAAAALRAGAPAGLLAARLAAGRCSLRHGDATAPGTLSRYSHVYMYDKVFSDATSASLAAALSQPPSAQPARVLVSYRRPEGWRRLGLSDAWVCVSSVTMRTTGAQNFRAYILVNTAGA
jgi:hypothetical protein